MSTRRPPVGEMTDRHIAGALDELHTWLPAVVVRYDAALQQVDVKPLVKHAFYDAQGKRNLESLGVVTNVPVRFMSAGGFTLTCPISDGQTSIKDLPTDPTATVNVPATRGTLFFSEASLDRWLSGTGEEVDPETDERHTENSGVFVPGLNPFGDPLPGVLVDHMFAGWAGGIGAHFFKSMIVLGDIIGSKKVALDGDLASGGTWSVVSNAGTATVTLTYTSADFAGAVGVQVIFASIAGLTTITGVIGGVPFGPTLTVPLTSKAVAGAVVASATQVKGK